MPLFSQLSGALQKSSSLQSGQTQSVSKQLPLLVQNSLLPPPLPPSPPTPALPPVLPVPALPMIPSDVESQGGRTLGADSLQR